MELFKVGVLLLLILTPWSIEELSLILLQRVEI